MHQPANERTARLGVMNNSHGRWLRKRAFNVHHVPLEPARCHAEHSELKIFMLSSQLKQLGYRQSYRCRGLVGLNLHVGAFRQAECKQSDDGPSNKGILLNFLTK